MKLRISLREPSYVAQDLGIVRTPKLNPSAFSRGYSAQGCTARDANGASGASPKHDAAALLHPICRVYCLVGVLHLGEAWLASIPYGTTASARFSTEGGMTRRIALAEPALITNSKRGGIPIGSSAG